MRKRSNNCRAHADLNLRTLYSTELPTVPYHIHYTISTTPTALIKNHRVFLNTSIFLYSYKNAYKYTYNNIRHLISQKIFDFLPVQGHSSVKLHQLSRPVMTLLVYSLTLIRATALFWYLLRFVDANLFRKGLFRWPSKILCYILHIFIYDCLCSGRLI